jgi:dTMP kinase
MFITFEGGEGSGKTTLIQALVKWLKEHQIDCVATREPGGSDIAEKIRAIILDQQNTHMRARTEALLFAAARVQHLEETVIPALDKGKVVLCDRYIDSSLAYQGHARGLSFDAILKINTFALEHMPDVTVYINSDPQIGLARIKSRENNRLDLEQLDFHQKVREGYLLLAKMYPKRYMVINGDRTMQEVIDDVKAHLKDVLLCRT